MIELKKDQSTDVPVTINIPQFQQDLITWFEKEQRILPWRENTDPYRVWVSEIMLQQTKVDTVIPYFNRFIEKFPTLADLAYASEQEVLKAWEGLGYYSRVRNLQAAVREVVEKYDAKVPTDVDALASLKGVGPYTKGAIMSIAFSKPEPAVDGNVMRVLSRIADIEEDIAKASTRKIFENVVRQVISQTNPSAFNQGLMELGALICTPKNPSCLLCPVQQHCIAFQKGKQTELPIKSKKLKKKTIHYYTFVIENVSQEVVLEKRPDEGLLAQMWQFPMVEKDKVSEQFIETYLTKKYQISSIELYKMEPIKHVFSHLTWYVDVIYVKMKDEDIQLERNEEIVTIEQFNEYPLPVPHQKVYEQWMNILAD